MTVYKIRKGGLFSTGGTSPCFSEVGKTWKRKGDLMSHLTLISKNRYSKHDVYDGCDIVVFELVEVGTFPNTPDGIIKAKQYDRKTKKSLDAEEKLRRDKHARMLEYIRLKREFDGEL